MQDRQALAKTGQTLGFNVGQAEKDYLQHIILLAVSESTGHKLVFKGGTCLQKTLNMPRYSEDLDFNAAGADTKQMYGRISERLRQFGYENTYAAAKPTAGETVKYKVKGPLYDGTAFTEASVQLDLSMREEVTLPAKTQSINPPYEDVPAYTVNTMDEREILAEKIRALLKRSRARDLYDINYLLRKGIPLDWSLLEKKLNYYQMEADSRTIGEAIRKLEKAWPAEMKQLTREVPDYKAAADYVLGKTLGAGRIK